MQPNQLLDIFSARAPPQNDLRELFGGQFEKADLLPIVRGF